MIQQINQLVQMTNMLLISYNFQQHIQQRIQKIKYVYLFNNQYQLQSYYIMAHSDPSNSSILQHPNLNNINLHNSIISSIHYFQNIVLSSQKQMASSQNQPSTSIKIPAILPPSDLKTITTSLSHLKQTLFFLVEIANTNKEALTNFLKQQTKEKQKSQEQNEEYSTFKDDLIQIKDYLTKVGLDLQKVQKLEEEIRQRINEIHQQREQQKKQEKERLTENNKKLQLFQQQKDSLEQKLKNVKQQSQKLTNSLSQYQQKISTLQKNIIEKDKHINQIQQQKENLKKTISSQPKQTNTFPQITDLQKKLSQEMIKTQQKQIQIEQLKKQIEQNKVSMITLADQLKSNSIKMKKIMDKYDGSKAEVKKFKQDKTEEIQKLNQSNTSLKNNISELQKSLSQSQSVIKQKITELQELRSKYQSCIHSTFQEGNLQVQVQSLSTDLSSCLQLSKNQKQTIQVLQSQLRELKQKRESLLKLVQDPAKHQISRLEGINGQLQNLYKDYVVQVFQKGNTVGFQRRIKDVMMQITQLVDQLSE